MDTRRLIVALFASMAVFMLWMAFVQNFLAPPPSDTAEPTTQTTEEDPASATTATAPAPGTGVPTATADAALPDTVRALPGPSRGPVSLGSSAPDGLYPMELAIDPEGASVARVLLRDYKQTVDKEDPYQLLHTVEPPDRVSRLPMPGRSFVTPKIRFLELDRDVDLGNVVWTLDASSTESTKIWYVDIVNGEGTPLARVTKAYTVTELPRNTASDKRTYDLDLSVTVENRSDRPQRLILVQRGPIGVDREDQRADDRLIISAVYPAGSSEISVNNHRRDKVLNKKVMLGDDEKENWVAWAAVTNKFFAAIMTPRDRYGPQPAPVYSVESVHLTDIEKIGEDPFGEDLSFDYITSPFTLTAGSSRAFDFECFLGPKSKRTLEGVDKYAKREYFATIGQYFYFCAPQSLGRLMMWLLISLHDIPPHNYGLAIIVLVLVVRALLHPITKKSQANMMRMQKRMSTVQPKLQEAKKKYANDQQKYNQAMMEIYREAGINPAGQMLACMPMMLQIPIWAALWASLNSMNEMRHAAFLPFWITDLAGQDALIAFGGAVHIPIISWLTGPIHAFNLLPILLGVSQLLQARFMPRGNPAVKSSQSPDQLEQQRKMMMFMSGFFVLILYNAPSGLNLYIMCSNFFGILEQWRIRQHLAEEDVKLEKEKKEIESGLKKPAKPKKETWLEKKWRDLQKQAEEAQRIQSQRKKK